MQSVLDAARASQDAILATIEQLVRCESPSDSPRDLAFFNELLVELAGGLAKPKLLPPSHLRLDFELPGVPKNGRILALGHSDTVWPLGTLRTMPCGRSGNRFCGPGVLDMKSGLAFFLHAARLVRDLDLPVSRHIALLVVSDEETGSQTSRHVTESEARRSDCVLVLEPGTGFDGKLKTARKGIAAYQLVVQGKAAHAGVDFTQGASAIVELAHQIERLAALTDIDRGVTVNPGVISGGTRSNVVAAEASVSLDVRVLTNADAAYIDRALHALEPIDPRCFLQLSGGLNRPPMERTPAIAQLYGQAHQIACEMGIALEESFTGGGSDGNFTAALGIPTLDGLGGVGEGAHAPNESILVDRVADRTALLAGLLSRL